MKVSKVQYDGKRRFLQGSKYSYSVAKGEGFASNHNQTG
jgi:hypothetical protein